MNETDDERNRGNAGGGHPTTDDSDAESDAIPDEAYTYALEQLLKGLRTSEIWKSLIDAGYTDEQADEIVQYAKEYRDQHEAKPGPGRIGHRAYLIFGLALLAGGVFMNCGGSPGALMSLIFLLMDIAGVILILVGIDRYQRNKRPQE